VTADGPESEPAAEHLVGGIPLASLVRDFHRPMLKFARTMVNSPALAEERCKSMVQFCSHRVL